MSVLSNSYARIPLLSERVRDFPPSRTQTVLFSSPNVSMGLPLLPMPRAGGTAPLSPPPLLLMLSLFQIFGWGLILPGARQRFSFSIYDDGPFPSIG